MLRLSHALPAGELHFQSRHRFKFNLICARLEAHILFLREELPKDLAKESNVNKEARAALNKIFPGYEVGR